MDLSGVVKGRHLLEIGTGATIHTIHTIITASEHVQNILLSDYAVQSRQIFTNWLKGERELDRSTVI